MTNQQTKRILITFCLCVVLIAIITAVSAVIYYFFFSNNSTTSTKNQSTKTTETTAQKNHIPPPISSQQPTSENTSEVKSNDCGIKQPIITATDLVKPNLSSHQNPITTIESNPQTLEDLHEKKLNILDQPTKIVTEKQKYNSGSNLGSQSLGDANDSTIIGTGFTKVTNGPNQVVQPTPEPVNQSNQTVVTSNSPPSGTFDTKTVNEIPQQKENIKVGKAEEEETRSNTDNNQQSIQGALKVDPNISSSQKTSTNNNEVKNKSKEEKRLREELEEFEDSIQKFESKIESDLNFDTIFENLKEKKGKLDNMKCEGYSVLQKRKEKCIEEIDKLIQKYIKKKLEVLEKYEDIIKPFKLNKSLETYTMDTIDELRRVKIDFGYIEYDGNQELEDRKESCLELINELIPKYQEYRDEIFKKLVRKFLKKEESYELDLSTFYELKNKLENPDKNDKSIIEGEESKIKEYLSRYDFYENFKNVCSDYETLKPKIKDNTSTTKDEEYLDLNGQLNDLLERLDKILPKGLLNTYVYLIKKNLTIKIDRTAGELDNKLQD